MYSLHYALPSRNYILNELADWNDDFNRFFDGFSRPGAPRRYPPVNAWTRENDIVIDVELPGVDPGKVELSLNGKELTISGTRETEQAVNGRTYQTQERASGHFSRTLELPFQADAAKVEAKYKDGILRIKLTRAEEDKPRRIQIAAA